MSAITDTDVIFLIYTIDSCLKIQQTENGVNL